MTICAGCGVEFVPVNAKQRFHDSICRTRTWRRGGASETSNVETTAANRDRVVVIAEGLEGSSDVDNAILEAALSLAGQVDRNPGNSMMWSRYQSALRELQMAVRASQEAAFGFQRLRDDLALSALLLARDRGHYGEGFWLGGDRTDRFRPFVEAALAERHYSWRDLWERGFWNVYPIGDDRCQVVLGSLPICEVELSDVGLDAGGRALESHNGRRRRE